MSTARAYTVPAVMRERVGLDELTLPMLASASLRPGEVGEWAARMVDRIEVRAEVRQETVLAMAGVRDRDGHYGILDPTSEEETPTIIGLLRIPDEDDGASMDPVQSWGPQGWFDLPGETDPIGMQTLIIEDPSLLSDVLSALSDGAAVALRPTQPRAWLPGPSVMTAAGDPSLPLATRVFAVVDHADASAVLSVFYIDAQGQPMSLNHGTWTPDNNLGFSLRGAVPPVVKLLTPDQIASVVRQVDDYDQAHPKSVQAAAGVWAEDQHPRKGGKFAAKGSSSTTNQNGMTPEEQAASNYVSGNGPAPAGVVPGTPLTARQQAVQAEQVKRAAFRAKAAKALAAETARRVNHARALKENYAQRLADGEDPKALRADYQREATQEINRRQQFSNSQTIDWNQEKARRAQYTLQQTKAAVAKKAAKAPLWASGGLPTSTMSPKLQEYWTHGKGAARIRWGTHNDFYRCRRQLAKYLHPEQLSGACANLHKVAIGVWPGQEDARKHGVVRAAATPLETQSGGVMIALYPDPEIASQVALDNGDDPSQLHVTLGYFGDVDELEPEDLQNLLESVRQTASTIGRPIEGTLNGYGRFVGVTADGSPIPEVKAAGVALMADDTGRVLMLQRALDNTDPASGTWEFPGGCLEDGETPQDAATREWEEETGGKLPDCDVTGIWTSPNGVYRGFVYHTPVESEVALNPAFKERAVTNPDDPRGDIVETAAWFDPAHLPDLPGLREEAKDTPWHLFGVGDSPVTAGGDPLYLNVDCPDMPELHSTLHDYLDMNEIPAHNDHGFTPHMTLSYLDRDDPTPQFPHDAPIPVKFNNLVLSVGDQRFEYPLAPDEGLSDGDD